MRPSAGTAITPPRGSVGAKPVQGRIRHERPPPHFVGPLHLYRFSLDQASLRRWEGNGILRSTASALVPRYGCQPAKPCCLGTQPGPFSGDQKILSDLRCRICRKYRYVTSSTNFRSPVIGRCQSNRLTSRFLTAQLPGGMHLSRLRILRPLSVNLADQQRPIPVGH